MERQKGIDRTLTCIVVLALAGSLLPPAATVAPAGVGLEGAGALRAPEQVGASPDAWPGPRRLASMATALTAPSAPRPLRIPSPYHVNQWAEPAVVHTPQPWHGHSYWMVVTPYIFTRRCREGGACKAADG
jgi:hypothetical protein